MPKTIWRLTNFTQGQQCIVEAPDPATACRLLDFCPETTICEPFIWCATGHWSPAPSFHYLDQIPEPLCAYCDLITEPIPEHPFPGTLSHQQIPLITTTLSPVFNLQKPLAQKEPSPTRQENQYG